MRSALVVFLTPLLQEDLRGSEVDEEFAVEAFVPQLAVEAFNVTVLPWGAEVPPKKWTGAEVIC